jgi:hypothetical protein
MIKDEPVLSPASSLLVRKNPLKMKTHPANTTAVKENQRIRLDFFLRPPPPPRNSTRDAPLPLDLYGRSGASDRGTRGRSEGPVAPKLCCVVGGEVWGVKEGGRGTQGRLGRE